MLENTGTSITVYVCFRGSQKDTKQRFNNWRGKSNSACKVTTRIPTISKYMFNYVVCAYLPLISRLLNVLKYWYGKRELNIRVCICIAYFLHLYDQVNHKNMYKV